VAWEDVTIVVPTIDAGEEFRGELSVGRKRRGRRRGKGLAWK
jgi:hypothetical protein